MLTLEKCILLSYECHRMQVALERSVKRATRFGLPQLGALCALDGADGAMTVSFLADRLGIAHHTMSETARTLESLGLVRRARDSQADRRLVQVSLTPQGHELVMHLRETHTNEYAGASGALVTPDRIAQVEATLQAITDLLERHLETLT